MGGVRHWLGIALALSLSGCATLTAPDEVEALQDATDDFTEALKGASLDMEGARIAAIVENGRNAAALGATVKFDLGCMKSVADHVPDTAKIIPKPYVPRDADNSFAAIRLVSVCGLEKRTRTLDVAPAADELILIGRDAAVGSPSLTGAARRLQAYVAALSDIATGKSSGKADAARGKLFAAGKGLLGALKIGTPADAILGVVEQALSSIIAARRNALTREFLDEMDRVMPLLMERMGIGGRLAVATAIQNRTSAAEKLARYGSRALAGTGRLLRPGSPASLARIALFDSIVARLEEHNSVIERLRAADPMIAARDFASAHRALRNVYHDPRANRRIIAEGLADFTESAAALKEALDDTSNN